MRETNSILEKLLDRTSNGTYDCSIMFTGGKDSTYLLWLMQEVYGKKSMTITIDNGFSDSYASEKATEICEQMHVKHIIVRQEKNMLTLFYKTMIEEQEIFKKVYHEDNFVCQICNYMLLCVASHTAEENHIPTLVTGMDIAQIESLGVNLNNQDEMANIIINKMLHAAIYKTHTLFEETNAYKTNTDFAKFIDTYLRLSKKVNIVFPFRFLKYNVEEIKSTIVEEVGWVPPVKNESIQEYVSSGCKIVELLYDIESIGLVGLNRKKYFSILEEDGAFEDYQLKERPLNLENETLKELGLRDFVEDYIEKSNKN